MNSSMSVGFPKSVIGESPQSILAVFEEIKRRIQPGRGRIGVWGMKCDGVVAEKSKWLRCAREIGYHWVLYPGCNHAQMSFIPSSNMGVPLDRGVMVQKTEWFDDLVLCSSAYAPIGFAPQIITSSTSK